MTANPISAAASVSQAPIRLIVVVVAEMTCNVACNSRNYGPLRCGPSINSMGHNSKDQNLKEKLKFIVFRQPSVLK